MNHGGSRGLNHSLFLNGISYIIKVMRGYKNFLKVFVSIPHTDDEEFV